MVTQSRLKEVLSYDEDTGLFAWKVNKGRLAQAGTTAGSVNSSGYVIIWIDGRQYKASRLAWLYVNGTMPNGIIDHINRVRTDDRIKNLRLASRIENGQNLSPNRANKSGVVGVSWHKRTKRWTAQIMFDGEKIYLGIFKTIEEAAAARSAAKAKYHKFHPEDNNEKAA